MVIFRYEGFCLDIIIFRHQVFNATDYWTSAPHVWTGKFCTPPSRRGSSTIIAFVVLCFRWTRGCGAIDKHNQKYVLSYWSVCGGEGPAFIKSSTHQVNNITKVKNKVGNRILSVFKSIHQKYVCIPTCA